MERRTATEVRTYTLDELVGPRVVEPIHLAHPHEPTTLCGVKKGRPVGPPSYGKPRCGVCLRMFQRWLRWRMGQ